ncbi:MAG TPA: glycosyltransferase family 4 protein [Blastocatellia bacterium]|nr:glycosyltransferase family 4 protein [Blastocatellia bacterium]
MAIKTIDESKENTESVSGTQDSALGTQHSVVLLDLSEDKGAARRWASNRFPGSEIKTLDKSDLRRGSKRERINRIRALKPDTFAFFTWDLNMQSVRSAMILFSALAGARHIVLEDHAGRRISRSRLSALMIEGPRFALELALGFVLIIPLSWLLTALLRIFLPFREVARASKKRGIGSESRMALHIRATLVSSTAGGMASHIQGFARGAKAAGHQLTFISVGNDLNEFSTHENEPRFLLKPSPAVSATRGLFELWNNLVFTFNTLLLIERGEIAPDKIDFIYQRYSRFNWTGVVISLVTGLPLALEYNGSEVWISRRWNPISQLWLLKKFERLNQIAADKIFVVSEVERRNLIRAGVDAKKIIVNPNGVDTDLFRPGRGGARVRQSLGVEGKIVVGFIGTFGPWHGAPALAEAATKTRKDVGCHFLFIGDGNQRNLAESIIERGGATPRTTFTGRIPHAEAPDYLDACDILVSPHVESTDGSEFFGSPTKLFEYMASARPIVASRLGQIADIIGDGENGLLVEPGDSDALARAIERLARDEALRARLGEAARRTVIERYTWKDNAARVFDAMNREL